MYKEQRVGRIEGRVGDGNQGQDGEELHIVVLSWCQVPRCGNPLAV